MSTLSRDEIFSRIQALLEEQFEVGAAQITPDAKLYDDLDIDSIDAVNLIIELKTITIKKLSLEDFKEVRTVSDVVDAVERVLQEQSA